MYVIPPSLLIIVINHTSESADGTTKFVEFSLRHRVPRTNFTVSSAFPASPYTEMHPVINDDSTGSDSHVIGIVDILPIRIIKII